jgi:hypothetical protein
VSLREHSGNFQGTFKELSRNVQGTLRGFVEMASEPPDWMVQCLSGNIQGTFRELSRNFQGTFKERSRNIERVCGDGLGAARLDGTVPLREHSRNF